MSLSWRPWVRRLARLNVSLELAVYLSLGFAFCRWILPVIAESQIIGCGNELTHYTYDTAEALQTGWLGWRLGLAVLGVAWVETRARLRPWFRRALRLAGPLWLASLTLPVLVFVYRWYWTVACLTCRGR